MSCFVKLFAHFISNRFSNSYTVHTLFNECYISTKLQKNTHMTF